MANEDLTQDPNYTTPGGVVLPLGARNPHQQIDLVHGGNATNYSAISSLSTSTSTAISTVDSSIASLSTSTSSGLSEMDSSISSLSTSISVLGDEIYRDTTSQKPFVLMITGQSNACGARSGGENPASTNVKTWDGDRSVWGGSNYTQTPWSDSAPNGNLGNNNVGLSLAHRITAETGRPVYIIYDALGGRPIEDWMGSGTASVRWVSLQSKVAAALASTELASAGVTKVDVVMWAQGEENALTDTFNAYTAKLETLVTQFRTSSWFDTQSPILIMGMSNLHTRYQVTWSQVAFCEIEDRNCIYVNSAGLKTQYDFDGTGDATHFLGAALWEAGYQRAWYALQSRAFTHRIVSTPAFYARGSGPWHGQATAIAQFDHLVSRESASSEFPFNSHAATGSIAWGYKCVADGNYTMAGGYQVATGNVCNYSLGWGRDITFSDAADYSAGFGYQNTLNAPYSFAAGRGHTVADSGSSALGMFSYYKTTQTNPVVHQIGIGTSLAAAKNAVTVRADGLVELLVSSAVDPEKNSEASLQLVNNTTLKVKVRGTDGVVRGVNLTLS